MAERYWIETLGCPKNQVDSDKLVGTLTGDGFEAADSPEEADLVVVNTCAFIEAARQESIDTVLTLADARRDGARLVVTGCMAERYGDELAEALPEVDLVAPFGASLTGDAGRSRSGHAGRRSGRKPEPPGARLRPAEPAPAPRHGPVGVREGGRGVRPQLRLLRHPVVPRQAAVAHGRVDPRRGGPARRGRRAPCPRSCWWPRTCRRSPSTARADAPSPGIDGPAVGGNRPIVDLVAAVAERVRWTRLLYLYPSTLDDALVEAILATGVPYFDLSLQHVSRPLLKRMRRWGEGDRFLERIRSIRAAEPTAAFRSSFIVGYPGETEEDHDRLLAWIEEAQLDWVGFFPFSNEAGTYAADLDGQVPEALVTERIRECTELQDAITAGRARGPDRRRRSRCWSTRPARPAPTARRPRSTGS